MEAEFILKKVKRDVKAKLYQFIYAIDLFEFIPVREKLPGCMCTDGEHIFYNPAQLKKVSKNEGLSYLEYEIAHMTIHGMLGHYEEEPQLRHRKLVWVIMDAQVKMVLEKMGIEQNRVEDFMMGFGRNMDEKKVISGYSAYYKALKSKRERSQWLSCADDYFMDDHSFWRRDVIQAGIGQNDQGDEDNPQKGSKNDGKHSKQRQNRISVSVMEKWRDARKLIMGKAAAKMSVEQCMQEMVDMQQSKRAGSGVGNYSARVEKAAGMGRSYNELIQQFLKEKEYCKELTDSLDVMLYSYGLELYGDVPLVEPNEVNEIKQLGSLVIAIDTSGSCSGQIASRFIRETYNLFRDIQDTVTFENIYLMECDMMIQEEKCLTSVEELKEEIIRELHGFGGTSFIPVFERIEELQRTEDLKVDALIYLTDSEGSFPRKKPDYPVFLVIPEEYLGSDGSPYNHDIPQWAEWVSMD